MKRIAYLMMPVAFVAGAASAQMVEGDMPTVADSDGNGTYSQAEVNTVWPDLEFGKFGEMDLDLSGELSMEELQAGWDAGILMGLTVETKGDAESGG
jgi:hypothetical protein